MFDAPQMRVEVPASPLPEAPPPSAVPAIGGQAIPPSASRRPAPAAAPRSLAVDAAAQPWAAASATAAPVEGGDETVLAARLAAAAAWRLPPPQEPSPADPVLDAPALDSDDLARGRRLLAEQGALPSLKSSVARRKPAGASRRWIWGLLAASGGALLCLQALLAWHDQIAQSVPVLRPVVEVVCVMVDCRVEAARQPQAFSIESSELVQLGGTVYQITVVLRNRVERELAPPSIDLRLTNAREEVVVRRVLKMSDLGLRARVIGPRQELSLQAALNTGERQIAGYTIELFYP